MDLSREIGSSHSSPFSVTFVLEVRVSVKGTSGEDTTKSLIDEVANMGGMKPLIEEVIDNGKHLGSPPRALSLAQLGSLEGLMWPP